MAERFSTYIPNFRILFIVLNEMFRIMSNRISCYKSYQNEAHLPTIRYLYGVLCYYRVLLVMEHVQYISEDQQRALNILRRCLPPEKIYVPDPLVPFFQACNAFRPANNSIQWVTPRIPVKCGMKLALCTAFEENMRLRMPDLIGIARIHQRLHTYSKDEKTYQDWCRFNLHDTTAESNKVPELITDEAIDHHKWVHVGLEPFTGTMYNEMVKIRKISYMPPSIPCHNITGTGDMIIEDKDSLLSYLQLNGQLAYFSTLRDSHKMFDEAFTKLSTRFSEIPLSGSGYASVHLIQSHNNTYNKGVTDKTFYVQDTAATTTPAFAAEGYVLEPLIDNGYGNNTTNGITTEEVKLATFTQINYSYAAPMFKGIGVKHEVGDYWQTTEALYKANCTAKVDEVNPLENLKDYLNTFIPEYGPPRRRN